MSNTELWTSFDEVFCLSLEGDTERQRHASAELCRVGLSKFKFIDGVKADSEAVKEAFRTGNVKSFPPCFRCGFATCGRADCNNVLIEPQVGCFLSFIKIFSMAIASTSNTFLFTEDDVKFHDYALDLASAAFRKNTLEELGFFSAEPCLIGLGKGLAGQKNPSFDGSFEFVARRKQPQNPCFAFNRAFAELAVSRFQKVSHTADVYIHFELSDEAQHYSLEPSLAYELSSSTGTLPSKIHPKQITFENLSNTEEVRQRAKADFTKHLKHVRYVPLVVIGNPRGGTGFMSHALAKFGLDVGHETLGADGISSWLFAVDDVNLPFGEEGYARNSRFVFAEKTIAVVRTSPQAVFSIQLENAKNIQSYCFRKKWIKHYLDVDLDVFASDFDRALAAYVFWYRIVARRNPIAWISLERAEHDLARLFRSGLLPMRECVESIDIRQVINAGKPYFGQIYDPISSDFDSHIKKADPFLRKQYNQLKSELFSTFHIAL